MGWEGDWTSADALRGRRPIAVLNQLRAALAERRDAVESFFSTNTAFPPLLSEGEISRGWFGQFQETLTRLLPRYADFNDNDGNWQGKPQVKTWSTGILDYVDVNTRIPVPKIASIDWIWQQYQIINLLKWAITPLLTSAEHQALTGLRRNTGNVDTNWDGIASHWNNASWESDSPIFAALGSMKTGPESQMSRTIPSSPIKHKNRTGFTAKVDSYIQLRISVFTVTGQGDNFYMDMNEVPQPNISVIDEFGHCLVKVFDNETLAPDDFTSELVFSQNNSLFPNPQDFPPVGSLSWRIGFFCSFSPAFGFGNTAPHIIAKLDVSGGFSYGDW